MKIVPLFFQYSGGAFVEFYPEKDENRLHSVVNWIVDSAVVIAFACYLVYGFGGRIEVNGGSMKPVLDSGDVVLVNRLAYALGSPRRFDIAVFSQGDQAFNMKRIIGLPGETVQIRENRVYINGEPLEAEEALDAASIAGLAEYPMELSEDEYFLLGDNRESSEDSRFPSIGNVKRDQLIGKVWFRIQPFSQFGPVSLKGEEG